MAQNTNHKPFMKKAAVELIIVWIALFSVFTTSLFFIINYGAIIRSKNNLDALSEFGANMVASRGPEHDIIDELNSVKARNVNTISSSNLTCERDHNEEFQIVFLTRTTNTKYKFFDGLISSRRVVYNQLNSDTVSCILTVTLSE